MVGGVAVRMVGGMPVPLGMLGAPTHFRAPVGPVLCSAPTVPRSAPTVPRDPVNVQKASVNSALGKMLRGEI
jgi:hypothetical protein